MGLSSSGDNFNKMCDDALWELPPDWYRKVIDDILVFGDTKEECYFHFKELLKVLSNYGIIISLEKIKEGKLVPYFGYVLSINPITSTVNVVPCEEKVQAILKFPQPTNRTELR